MPRKRRIFHHLAVRFVDPVCDLAVDVLDSFLDNPEAMLAMLAAGPELGPGWDLEWVLSLGRGSESLGPRPFSS